MNQNNSLDLTPFSYVQDKEKNIYTVRIVDKPESKVFAQLSYKYVNGSFIKTKEFNRTDFQKHIKWLSYEDIVKYWQLTLLDTAMIQQNIVLEKLYQLSLCNNANLFLFGSRLLRIEKPLSDWDFIVQCANPRLFYEKIIQNITEIRPYSESELFERAKRFTNPNSMYYTDELYSIFKQTCTYTKYNDIDIDIGLFFVKSFHNLWTKGTEYVQSLNNCILNKELSDSYSMPRFISITKENNTVARVIYNDWLLYGIEDVQCEKIYFFNLWKVNDNLYVLDNKEGYVKFE